MHHSMIKVTVLLLVMLFVNDCHGYATGIGKCRRPGSDCLWDTWKNTNNGKKYCEQSEWEREKRVGVALWSTKDCYCKDTLSGGPQECERRIEENDYYCDTNDDCHFTCSSYDSYINREDPCYDY